MQTLIISSNPRIILHIRRIRRVEGVPVGAIRRQRVEVHGRGDAGELLEELHAEALRDVPRSNSTLATVPKYTTLQAGKQATYQAT